MPAFQFRLRLMSVVGNRWLPIVAVGTYFVRKGLSSQAKLIHDFNAMCHFIMSQNLDIRQKHSCIQCTLRSKTMLKDTNKADSTVFSIADANSALCRHPFGHQRIYRTSHNHAECAIGTTPLIKCIYRRIRDATVRLQASVYSKLMINALVIYQACDSSLADVSNTVMLQEGLSLHRPIAATSINYRPRSRGDNTFGSVRVSVRLSVGALLFEPFDL